jgi:hypothetical protein
MTEKTGKPERPESWKDRRVGTTGSWNDWRVGTTGKLERLESWNDRKAGTTGELERPESRNNLTTIGGTLPAAPIINVKLTISTNNKIIFCLQYMGARWYWCNSRSSDMFAAHCLFSRTLPDNLAAESGKGTVFFSRWQSN